MTEHSQPGSLCRRQGCSDRARVCRECVRAITLQWCGAISRHAASGGARCDLCEIGLTEVCGKHFLDDVADRRARMCGLGHRIGEPAPPSTLAMLAGVAQGRAQADAGRPLMSPRDDHRDDPPQLQVAALGAVHLAVDGRPLCGQVRIDEPDIYSDPAGLSAWNAGPLARCGKCSAALVARVRQPRALPRTDNTVGERR